MTGVEHPKFVCRREGHDPQIKVANVTASVTTSIVTHCKRCGDAIEIPIGQRP